MVYNGKFHWKLVQIVVFKNDGTIECRVVIFRRSQRDRGEIESVIAAETQSSGFSLHFETGAAEIRHPEEDEDDGRGHGAVDKLANRPPSRDLGQEDADEGRVGIPKAPEEGRPHGHPFLWAVGFAVVVGAAAIHASMGRTRLLPRVGVTAKLDQRGQVKPDVLRK